MDNNSKREKHLPIMMIDKTTQAILEVNNSVNEILGDLDFESLSLSDVIECSQLDFSSDKTKKGTKQLFKTKRISDGKKLLFSAHSELHGEKEILILHFYHEIKTINTNESTTDLSNELVGNALFKEIFKHSPLALIVIDEDRKLVKANDYLFKRFNLPIQDVEGKRFGNTFHCSVLDSPDKLCGEIEVCLDCKFRNGVNEIIDNLLIIEGLVLSHHFTLNGRKTIAWFNISASPVMLADRVYALLSFVDITDRVLKENELKVLGLIDDLTGLYNRRYIQEIMNNSCDALKSKETLTIAFLDIDNFKRVNDTFGHLKGDDILRLLSNIMTSNVRDSDYVGRFGGEEFLIIFTQTPVQSAEKVVKRIQKNFFDQTVNEVVGGLTFSCGLAEVCVESLKYFSIKEIINEADKKLYEVKNNGKNNTKWIKL